MIDASIRGTARGQIPARLLDLSVGGALLHLSMPLEVGAIHDFALQIDGADGVGAGRGEALRRRAAGAGHQLGVEFIGIDPARPAPCCSRTSAARAAS